MTAIMAAERDQMGTGIRRDYGDRPDGVSGLRGPYNRASV